MSTNDDWKRLQELIKNEKELLQIMAELPEKEFHNLVTASREYATALKSKYDALREENAKVRASLEAQNLERKMEAEERMKRLEHQLKSSEAQEKMKREMELDSNRANEARRLAEYESRLAVQTAAEKAVAKLQAQREFAEMEANRIADEERLARVRHELEEEARIAAHRRETALKLALQEKKGEMRRQTELELAERKVEQDMRRHEQMKDWLAAKELEGKRIDAEAEVKKEELKWQAAQDFFAGREGRRRLLNGALFVCVCIGGFFFTKNVVTPFMAQAIRKRFFSPKLVSRKVTYNTVGRFLREKKLWPFQTLEPTVVLQPELRQRMSDIVKGTKLTSSRHGYFSHMMIYGKPGTGKTLFAEKLAAESHMDFAMMSGPSFSQFEPGEAIREIKNLFEWANTSRHGLLLFVDEADSFLEDRATMNPHRVAVLNEWINQTGTESKRFMCIYETNRPEVIDPAVQSRITRSIEFPTPGKDEIREMLQLYINLYLNKDARHAYSWNPFSKSHRIHVPDLQDYNVVDGFAQRLAEAHFVGRDISNLVIAWSQTAYASEDMSLSLADVERVLEEQIAKKSQEFEYLKTREGRLEHYRMHARVTMGN